MELTIAQERPFQDSYPDFSPYCHTKAIAMILFKRNRDKIEFINTYTYAYTHKCSCKGIPYFKNNKNRLFRGVNELIFA